MDQSVMLRNITILLAALLIAVAAHAQSSRPQFEAVSIKQNTSYHSPIFIYCEVEQPKIE